MEFVEEQKAGKHTVFICDDHNFVLEAWMDHVPAPNGPMSPSPPTLITLDAHTDTRPPFNRKACSHLSPSIPGPEELRSYSSPRIAKLKERETDFIRDLAHDEHIVAAYEAEVISECFILFSGNADGDEELHWSHTLKLTTPIDDSQGHHEKTGCDSVLESSQLVRWTNAIESLTGQYLEEMSYILDIDLDFFRTQESVHPKDPAEFLRLVRNASLITVAREPQCVRDGCLEGEELTAEYVWKHLESLIATA